MKIAVDAGHGLYTAGKRCLKSIDKNETREWTLNNRIATRVVELLSYYQGVETLRLDDTSGKSDIPLSSRAANANKWGADFCLSIHHNAGINGGTGGGMIVFTHTSVSYSDLQKTIYSECIARGGLAGRAIPLDKANFEILRRTNCPAILIEYGFMDSITDTPIILTGAFAENMAIGTVEALAKYFRLTKSVTDKIYHLWAELPEWARVPLMAMHKAGYYQGYSPSDLQLSQTKMECLVVIARALKAGGLLNY